MHAKIYTVIKKPQQAFFSMAKLFSRVRIYVLVMGIVVGAGFHILRHMVR